MSLKLARTAESMQGTAFEVAVWVAAQHIPKGKVTTVRPPRCPALTRTPQYAALAKKVGKGGPRAVGNALRKNPYAPVVPCHRIVRSSRELGGFMGQTDDACAQLCRKRALLEEEGVVLVRAAKCTVVDQACMVSEF
jgi:methylated-DNA-[protein]-cysteine S-methyltransferase